MCRRFVASLDGWSQELRPPLGLVHGDYRLDNMLFGAPGAPRPFAAVDWQTVGWGQVMTDASYFLGGSLTLEDRRAHEQELLREYHDALQDHGVRGFGWEECWEGYRRQAFLGVLMTVVPAMIVQRTERGDQMFLVTLARHAQQVLDLDAIELLPEPGSGRPPALRPDPADEAPHPAGTEELWNESWYFDAVSADEQLGVYTRLGLYPNLGVSWMTTFVCGPGRQTLALIDFAAPLPEGEQLSLATDELRGEHICIEPLESFEVRVRGTAESFTDAAAILRGERGDPVELALALRWDTTGEPYAYRAATRYEIPCRVSGTVRCGEETVDFNGVGQRDHSWGVRDWWSAEWMWSAVHLQDGTHLHGVEFRLPGAPPVSVGYSQPPEGGVEELDSVRAQRAGRRRRADRGGQDQLRRAGCGRAPAGLRSAAAEGTRRTPVAVPPRDVQRPHRRRTLRGRVGGVEPQRLAVAPARPRRRGPRGRLPPRSSRGSTRRSTPSPGRGPRASRRSPAGGSAGGRRRRGT